MKYASPADRKRGFQAHAFSFVVGIVVLAIVNYFSSPHYYWILWVLLGWGIGILAHWWFVLGPAASASHEADGSQR